MKKSIILFFALVCSFSVSAQIPQIQWQQSLGGTLNDGANCIIHTSDSGYAVAGFSFSNNGDVTGHHGGNDCWVVKINSSGTIQWQKSLGGTAWDNASSIIQTIDSGYIVAGESNSNNGDVTGNHGGSDYWVVKLNASGTIQWQQSFGGSNDDYAYSIIQTYDSGYVVAGFTQSNNGDVTGNHGGYDCWVVKLNASGTIQWQKVLGGTGGDEAYSIIQVSDSGYVVGGTSNSNDGDVTGNHGGSDFWVVKLNSSGTIEWQKSLGGTGDDVAFSLIHTSDSGFAVAGFSGSNNGDVTGNHGVNDYWVVKLDTSGTIGWQKSLGGTGDEIAYSLIQTTDSGFVAGGYSSSNDGDVTGNHTGWDYWLVKLSASGTIEFQKSLGGTADEVALSIIQTSDSGYVVAGASSSNDGDVGGNHGGGDSWIVKLGDTTGMNIIPPVISLSSSDTVMCENQCINFFDLSINAPTSWQWYFPGASPNTSTQQNPTNICYNLNGNYNVILVACNAAGCDSTFWPAFINVLPSPLAPVITVSNDTLFASGSYSFAWYEVSNPSIVIGTDSFFVFTPPNSYYVIATDNNGCAVSSNIVNTGVQSLDSQTFTISPNPSTDNFTVSANSEFDNAQLNIFNAMGCNVYSCRLTREAKAIDAESFPSGIYYLQIIKGEKVWGEKIIKQ